MAEAVATGPRFKFSCLDIGHKDFHGKQDYILFIPPFPFFEGTSADFADPTLEDCWYGRVVLLCSIRVKLDKKDCDGRSVQMDCD